MSLLNQSSPNKLEPKLQNEAKGPQLKSLRLKSYRKLPHFQALCLSLHMY